RDVGDFHRAAELHRQSLALWRKLGDRWGTAAALHDLGRVTEKSGDWWRAAQLFAESLAIFGELGVPQGSAACLGGMAGVFCDAGNPLEAARLLGAAEALREEVGAPMRSRDRQDLARTVARVRSALNARALRSAWAGGRSVSVETTATEVARLLTSLGVDR